MGSSRNFVPYTRAFRRGLSLSQPSEKISKPPSPSSIKCGPHCFKPLTSFINLLQIRMPSASLYSIAALETPRIIGKTKTVVFDAQMYMGPDQPPLTANLHYFNDQGLTFGDVGIYYIHATVCSLVPTQSTKYNFKQIARMCPEVQTYSEDFQSSDYQISGDIQWVRDVVHLLWPYYSQQS